MSFNALFHLSNKKTAMLLNKGLEGLTLKERAEYEIPILVASEKELNEIIPLLGEAPLKIDPSKLEAFCIFIGYPRSGHSLVGSLLNAHNEISISHELNVLNLMAHASLTSGDLYKLIIKNTEVFSSVGNVWGQYSYEVKGQHQGQSQQCKIIGDKKGGGTTQLLMSKPLLLDKLFNDTKLPIKMIHMVRNPFDNVATISAKESIDLTQAVQLYQFLCSANEQIMARMKSNHVIKLRHEDFIANPEFNLKELMSFFKLDVTKSYLGDCKKIITPSFNRSRDSIIWPDDIKNELLSTIEQYDFLSGYTFE